MAKVIFFGVLTDVAGTHVRHFNDASTVKQLLLLVEGEYPEIVHYDYRIAVNNEFIDGDLPLSDSDEVSLMPPFAGG